MADIETFRERYQELLDANIPREVIRQQARGAGFTDDEINSVMNPQPSDPSSPIQTDIITNNSPKQPHVVPEDNQNVNTQLQKQAVNMEPKVKSLEERPLETNKFLGKNTQFYQQIIDQLMEHKNNEDSFQQTAIEKLTNNLVRKGKSYDEALKQATDRAKETMKNFNISRYIQNNIYEPESTLDTPSRVEKYNLLQRKFNLSDEEANYWTEKWKEVAPSVLDSAAQAIENFSVGAKQDWYGALALGAQLFGFGDSEFAKNAKDKIKQLDAETTKINIERGSKLGAEDFSPVAILEAAATAAITASSLPASAVLASAAGLGALSGAVYAKGQGESDSSVAGSAVLGGALPLAIPAVAKVAKVMTDSLKTFLNVEGLYKRDIALYTQGLTAEEVIRASNFLSKRGGGTTEIAWLQKNSQSWINAGVFRGISLFLSGRDAEQKIVINNKLAIKKGIQDTLKDFNASNYAVTRDASGMIQLQDAIAESLVNNIAKAEKNLSHAIRAQYEYIDSVAENVFAPNRAQILEEVSQSLKEFPSVYPEDKLDKYLELIGKKLDQFSARTESQGGIVLKDLMDLQQSIKRDITSKESPAKLALSAANLSINKAKEAIIRDAQTALMANGELSSAESLMLHKLTTLHEEISKANEMYKQKIEMFNKDKLKNFLRLKTNSPEATELLNEIINKGEISDIKKLEYIYASTDNLKEFDKLGQRYILNGLRDVINETDNTISPKAVSFVDALLRDKNLMTAFNIPPATQSHLTDLSRAIKAAKRMEHFYGAPHLSQNSFAGRLVYLASNFLDVVRNIVTSKVYHGDELERLIHAAKKFEIPTEQEIKTWNQQKIKRDAMKWNFMGMGLNLNSNQGQE